MHIHIKNYHNKIAILTQRNVPDVPTGVHFTINYQTGIIQLFSINFKRKCALTWDQSANACIDKHILDLDLNFLKKLQTYIIFRQYVLPSSETLLLIWNHAPHLKLCPSCMTLPLIWNHASHLKPCLPSSETMLLIWNHASHLKPCLPSSETLLLFWTPWSTSTIA